MGTGRLRSSYGDRIAIWKPLRTRRINRGNLVPRFRTTSLLVKVSRNWYRYVWRPRVGWWCVSWGSLGCPIETPKGTQPYPIGDAMKRRSTPAVGHTVQAALPAASTILAKLPAIRAFVTDTQYDDGTPRTPGYLTIRNRGIAFEITLYDPDSGTRLPLRAPDLDKLLLLIEQLVGVEDAPWELDPYLTEQLERRAKKKKKGA
jgi:hypothetical protein